MMDDWDKMMVERDRRLVGSTSFQLVRALVPVALAVGPDDGQEMVASQHSAQPNDIKHCFCKLRVLGKLS